MTLVSPEGFFVSAGCGMDACCGTAGTLVGRVIG